MTEKSTKNSKTATEWHDPAAQAYDNEWWRQPKKNYYRHRCCACGLIHRVYTKTDERGLIWTRWIVDMRATGGVWRSLPGIVRSFLLENLKK